MNKTELTQSEQQEISKDSSFSYQTFPMQDEEPPAPKPKISLRQFFYYYSRSGGVKKNFFLRFFASFFFTTWLFNIFIGGDKSGSYLISHWEDYLQDIHLPLIILCMFAIFLLLTEIHRLWYRTLSRYSDGIVLLTSIVLFALQNLYFNENQSLCIALTLIFTISCLAVTSRFKIRSAIHPTGKFKPLIPLFIALFSICTIIFVAITTIIEYQEYRSTAYDFGIFIQAMYELSHKFHAVTTCERTEAISHFRIHASYILYLLVPICHFFDTAKTLLIAQAVLIVSGVIPCYFLAKHHHLTGTLQIAICTMYVFYPALIQPAYYYFHENAFLPALLMWLILFLEKQNKLGIFITTVLCLIVKEDAAIYVICLLLYCSTTEAYQTKYRKFLFTVLAGSVLYFAGINLILTKIGDGQFMTDTRFDAFLTTDEDNLVYAVLHILKNPTYFFSTLFSETSITFCIEMFLPLLFLPFFTNKLSRYFLFCPFFLINLIIGASYGYAVTLGYQYTMGTGVLLLYMSILNAKDLQEDKRRGLLYSCGFACFLALFTNISSEWSFVTIYNTETTLYTSTEELLSSIPSNASVAASTWYVPNLAQRDEVYSWDKDDIDYDDAGQPYLPDTSNYDFVVLAQHDELFYDYDELLQEAGYTVYGTVESQFTVYESPNYISEEDLFQTTTH